MADLATAVSVIAREAGAMAMARWRTDAVRSWSKADASPACEMDIAVDVMLRERLSALDPEAGWLSEETVDGADRLTRSRVWVVDPIDGTRDYLRGRRGWAVSIALVEDGQPVVAVLDAPARGEHWTATRGGGAWRNGLAIRAGRTGELAGARVPTDTLSRVDRDLVAVEKPNGIALRIAMVAADEADLVATLRWGHEWDIAAAVLIAGEAGAGVSDALGTPLGFNRADPRAFGVIVSAPAIHTAAVSRFADRARALSHV